MAAKKKKRKPLLQRKANAKPGKKASAPKKPAKKATPKKPAPPPKKASAKKSPKKAAPKAKKKAAAKPKKKSAPKAKAARSTIPQPSGGGQIHQTLTFEGAPDLLYDALLDSEMHTEITGSVANVEPRVGAKFNAWDGYIHGVVMELDPGRRIVKSWRASDFPPAHPTSRLELTFSPNGSGGTVLEVLHTGLPEEKVGDYDRGWNEFYWQPLRAWLSKRA